MTRPAPNPSLLPTAADLGGALTDADVAALVAFNHVPGIGPVRMQALIDHFGSAQAAWEAPGTALAQALDRRSFESLMALRGRLDPHLLVRRAGELDLTLLTWGHPDYPVHLAAISNPPYVLYAKGNLALLAEAGIAVVGTRRASEYGLRAAAHFAGELAGRGFTIVSGLAVGVDTAAHVAALEAGGQTIAVLGSGLDLPYPPQNAGLFATIAARGLVLSEVAPGGHPEPGNFPARNRIISGLSRGVVVIEAGLKSGALITAECALDQGREVWAVPGAIFSPRSEGANALLAAGAMPALRTADILDSLALSDPVSGDGSGDELRSPQTGVGPTKSGVRVRVEAARKAEENAHDKAGPDADRRATLAGPEASLLAALDAGALHIDELARRLEEPASEVGRRLTLLELRGYVNHLGGMRWEAVDGQPAGRARSHRRDG